MVLIKRKKHLSPSEREAQKKEKELRKAGIEDGFQAKGFEIADWFQHHQRTIVMGLAGFVGLGLVWAGINHWSGKKDQAAAEAYGNAAALYEKKDATVKDVKAALAAFLALEKEYPSSGVAELARLNAGHLALGTGDVAQAVKSYQAFLAGTSASDPMWSAGQMGLAFAYELSGAPEKALTAFEEISNSKWAIDEGLLLWEMARLAAQVGQKDKAIQLATQLTERYPDAPDAANANRLLASLSSAAKP